MKQKIFALAMVMLIVFTAACAPAAQESADVVTDVPATSDSGTDKPQEEQPAPQGQPEVIKIAFLDSMSGSNAQAGQLMLKGAQLAVKHINESGGIKSLGGAHLKLIVSDVTSDPAQTKNVAERALAEEGIVAALGTSNSALTVPLLPVTEKLQIPIVTACISAGIVDQGYKYVFQTPATGTEFGRTTAKFLAWLRDEKGMNLNKVAIVFEDSAYGVSTSDGTRAMVEELGFEVAFDASFPPGLTDASSIVTRMKASGAQIVFPTAFLQEAKLIMNTMKSMDYHPLVLGGGSGFLWPEFGKDMGEAANGLCSVTHWSFDAKNVIDNPEFVAITEDYELEYGEFMSQNGGTAYTAMQIISTALEESGSRDPVVIRDTISELKIETLLPPGTINFDETGLNINCYPLMIQWQNGVPRVVYPEASAGVSKYMDPEELK